MLTNLSANVDAVLNSRGLSWSQLSQTQKHTVIEASNNLEITLQKGMVKPKNKALSRRISRLEDQGGDKAFIYDQDTGEIIQPKYDTYIIGKFIDSDPDTSHDADELIERVESKGLFKRNDAIHKSGIDTEFLRDSSLKLAEWSLLEWLLENLTVKNYCMTTLSTFRGELQLTPSNLSNRIRSLSVKGCIRTINEDMHKRGDRLLSINPVYGFKGNSSLQPMLVSRWYRESKTV